MPTELFPPRVIIQQLTNDLPLPSYATEGAAGVDLYAANTDDIVLPPGERVLIKTGIKVQLSSFMEMQIRPRSGLALKHGITVQNSPGTVDSDYRGEVGVILVNHGSSNFIVKRGDRIAQAVFANVLKPVFIKGSVDETVRGEGGFGSTGVH